MPVVKGLAATLQINGSGLGGSNGPGLSLCGSSMGLHIRGIEPSAPKPLPAVPQRRPSFTSRSIHDIRPNPASRPLLVVSAGSSDEVNLSSAPTSTFTSRPPPVSKPTAKPLVHTQAWGSGGGGGSGIPSYASSYPGGQPPNGVAPGQMSPPAALKQTGPSGTTSSSSYGAGPSGTAPASDGPELGQSLALSLRAALSGSADSRSRTTIEDVAACEAQRLRAVRRLREQRERRKLEDDEERMKEEAKKEGAREKERECKEAAEKREQRRAEVLAINKLLAERDEAAYRAFVDGRQEERAEIDRRHAEEEEQQRRERANREKTVEEAAKARLREKEREARKERKAADALVEAERRKKADHRAEMSKKEEDRELWRAQVYAINKLMAAKDAEAFAAFKLARGEPIVPMPQWEGSASARADDEEADPLELAHRVQDALLTEKTKSGSSSLRSSKKKEKSSGSSVASASTDRVELSKSLPMGGGGASSSSSSTPAQRRSRSRDDSSLQAEKRLDDALNSSSNMSSRLGNALSRTWGGVSSSLEEKTSSGSHLQSHSAMAGSSGAVDEKEAALLRRLSKPRESESMLDLSEELKKKGKGGTYYQQQQREEQIRFARREKIREESRVKEEEREVTRAQIYAINKLMRQREEMAFAEFRLQREAEALEGGGGTDGRPSTTGSPGRARSAADNNSTSSNSDAHNSGDDGEQLHGHDADMKMPHPLGNALAPPPAPTVPPMSPRKPGSSAGRNGAPRGAPLSRLSKGSPAAAAAF